MTNFSDFWGGARNKTNSKKKSFKLYIGRFFSIVFGISSTFWQILAKFFKRIIRLPKVLGRIDKIALLILFVIFFALLGYKINQDYIGRTKVIPASGGTYKEVLIGEAKYFNPILAKTDTDKVVNRLIYSGLTKIDKNTNLVPDLAKSWEISPDGKTYTFRLRTDVSWHDGNQFTSADVVSTIEAIKDQNIKSPYFEAWKDVNVEAPDGETVIFGLNNPYGPFLYNTNVGIIPAHIDPNTISASPVGTGPFKFLKVVSDKNNKIQEVIIDRSDLYYDQKPHIEKVDFQVANDESEAMELFLSRSISAIAGVKVEKEGVANYSFPTSRYFGLVFNLRDDRFKDENLRKKISAGEKFEPEFEFKLLIMDKPLVISAAGSLKESYSKQGIKITIDKKSAIDFQHLIEKKNFQAVLYGFDSGYDRDPYPFWHSSQAALGSNLSGFSDKSADILLEDARMTADAAVRNQKYDQFFALINEKVPTIFLPPQDFNFSVKDVIKDVDAIKGFEPQDHLNSLADWYIKTKRVKP